MADDSDSDSDTPMAPVGFDRFNVRAITVCCRNNPLFLQLLLSEAQRASRKKGKDEVRELRRELEAERREKERETTEKVKERARHLGLLQGLAMAGADRLRL